MKAGIYIRVSSDEQVKGYGPDMQRARCRALATAKGWEVVAEYEDLGESGRKLKRPGLQAMMQAAKRREFAVLIVYKLDRLSRRARHLQEIWEDHLTANGVELASATESIDTTNPMGRAMAAMIGVFAQMESELFQERSTEGRLTKGRGGEFGNAMRLYGYAWNKEAGRPMPIEDELVAIRLAFEMAADQRSPEDVAVELNKRGVPKRRGGRWWNSCVRRLLQDPRYAGTWLTHDDPEEPVYARPELCPPPAVSPELFDRAQAALANYRGYRRPGVKRPFLLTSLIYCGHCSDLESTPEKLIRMTARQTDPVHSYYGCYHAAPRRGTNCVQKAIPAKPLEEKVWGLIKQAQADPEMVERIARRTSSDLLPGLRKQIAQVGATMKAWRSREREARRLLEMQTRGYTQDMFADTMAEYQTAMPALQATAAELETQIARAQERLADVTLTKQLLADAGDLDALDLAGKRRLLLKLGVRVIVRSTDLAAKRPVWEVELETFATAYLGASEGDYSSKDVSCGIQQMDSGAAGTALVTRPNR